MAAKRDDISKLGFLVTSDDNWKHLQEILFDLWDYVFKEESKVKKKK